MSQKWNLQDIRPAEPRKRRQTPRTDNNQSQSHQKEATSTAYAQDRDDIPNVIIENGNKNATSKLWLSIIIFIVIVASATGLSAILGKTELTIYPEFREPNINADFIAYPDKRESSLSYEILTLEATSEAQVEASGQIQIQEQATGVITISKTTPGAQRLIKNTRFRTPAGLIYRIPESVVVPGAVRNEADSLTPGTIQTEVFADEVGEKYNIDANISFDIPGFQEDGSTALFEAITAENSQPFTDGFDGPQFQIDESELSTARQALQIDLRNNLLARIETEKPADFIAFPDAVAITYNQLPAVEYGEDLVTIKEQAILQIPLFQTTDFGSFLAQETIATYEGNPVRVDDPSVLKFSYTSATTSRSVIANEPSLSFNLSGKPLLIWEYDIESLKSDLVTLPKTAINNAVLAYPGIDGARVRITPFWQRTFPEDPEDILVIEELKQPE
jgi:hypothetical protein